MANPKSSQQLSSGCLALFGLPFLAAGLFITWLYFSGFSKWWNARGWEEVPCSIESAELKSSSDGDGTTYRATASYRYQYDGRTYHGDRVSLASGGDNIGDFQQNAHREISQYAGTNPERRFRCFVNPAEPSEAVLYREFRWQLQAFMAVFALTFPAVGAGLVFGGLFGVTTSRKQAARRALAPDQPWTWTTGGATGVIPETPPAGTKAVFLYTLWSACVIAPLLVSTAHTGAFQTEPTAWLLVIFVLLWCIPAWLCIRRLRHRAAVGSARFEPQELPVSPGCLMDGAIVLEKPLPLRGTAMVTLECEKRITRKSGDGTSTATEKIWSHQEQVPSDSVTRDLTGFRLPVRFHLPADAPQSGDSVEDPATRHVWKLSLQVPGTSIHTGFEIPVFRTAKSPAVVAAAAPSIADDTAADLPSLLAARRIVAEFDAQGKPVVITCPPGRHRSLIVFLIIFDLIWTGAAVFLILQDAPLIFRVIWPLSSTVIWLLVFWCILHKRTVTFSPTGLEVRNQIGPVISTELFEKSQITGFSHDTNMSSNNTTFYRVRLESVLGKKKTLVDGITESTTAAALARRLDSWRTSS